MKIKYHEIIDSIKWCFINNDYHCQNAFIFGAWESDYFSVTTSGYSVEVEVKISKSDFKADFKKHAKHALMNDYKRGKVIIPNPCVQNMYDHSIKHFVEFCNFSISDLEKEIPNRFYYACPEGLIDVKKIPHYAGLLYVDKTGPARIIKQAPLLHKGKYRHLIKKLMDKFYYRNKSLEFDSTQFINERQRLNNRIKEYEEKFGKLPW